MSLPRATLAGLLSPVLAVLAAAAFGSCLVLVIGENPWDVFRVLLGGALGTLDGIGAVGGGAHANHEYIELDKLVERTALLSLLLASPPLSEMAHSDDDGNDVALGAVDSHIDTHHDANTHEAPSCPDREDLTPLIPASNNLSPTTSPE